MDTKKLHSLLVVAERGSLTAAAAELGYTQSGLTHMMNSLEDELGLRLLIRGKSGVHFSPEGLELLPELHALAAASDNLEKSVERIHQRNVSALRIGAFVSIGRHWVPEILSQFKSLSPDVQVSITMDGIDPLYSAVKNNELDCAMVSRQTSLLSGLCWVPIWDDELLAILPGSYEDDSGDFDVNRFHEAEFLMPAQGFEYDISPVFNRHSSHVTPHIRRTNMDDDSIMSMVEHGLGVSVLSRLVVQDMKYDVKALPLAPKAFRSLGIIFSERRTGDRNIRRLVSCTASYVTVKYGIDVKD